MSDVTTNPSDKEVKVADKAAERSERSIQRIVGLLRSKYEDEGTRNLRIGKEALEDVREQAKSIAGKYNAGDFDRRMLRIAEETRRYVAVKTIEVGKYVRAYEFTVQVRQMTGNDRIDKMPYHLIQRYLVPNAYEFDKAKLFGTVKEDWESAVRDLVEFMSPSEGPSPEVEAFVERFQEHADRIESSKVAKTDPAAVAVKAARDHERKITKARDGVREALVEAFKGDLVSPRGVQDVIDLVSKAHGVTMPTTGFNPSALSMDDCKTIAGAMFAAGDLPEMKFLRDQLDVLIKQAENAKIQSKAS